MRAVALVAEEELDARDVHIAAFCALGKLREQLDAGGAAGQHDAGDAVAVQSAGGIGLDCSEECERPVSRGVDERGPVSKAHHVNHVRGRGVCLAHQRGGLQCPGVGDVVVQMAQLLGQAGRVRARAERDV